MKINKKYLLQDSLKGKTINFDVDGTLIRLKKDSPRRSVIHLLENAKRKGGKVTVWSRNGKEYAQNVGRRLGISGIKYASKNKNHSKPDIAVDDEEHSLGIQNIRV